MNVKYLNFVNLKTYFSLPPPLYIFQTSDCLRQPKIAMCDVRYLNFVPLKTYFSHPPPFYILQTSDFLRRPMIAMCDGKIFKLCYFKKIFLPSPPLYIFQTSDCQWLLCVTVRYLNFVTLKHISPSLGPSQTIWCLKWEKKFILRIYELDLSQNVSQNYLKTYLKMYLKIYLKTSQNLS